MKNRLLKLSLVASLFMGLTTLQATTLDDKMIGHITHSIPWVEVRLDYAMSARQLANKYYGNANDASVIVKANKSIKRPNKALRKNMTVRIPVTSNFKDQPERLGWQK